MRGRECGLRRREKKQDQGSNSTDGKLGGGVGRKQGGVSLSKSNGK